MSHNPTRCAAIPTSTRLRRAAQECAVGSPPSARRLRAESHRRCGTPAAHLPQRHCGELHWHIDCPKRKERKETRGKDKTARREKRSAAKAAAKAAKVARQSEEGNDAADAKAKADKPTNAAAGLAAGEVLISEAFFESGANTIALSQAGAGLVVRASKKATDNLAERVEADEDSDSSSEPSDLSSCSDSDGSEDDDDDSSVSSDESSDAEHDGAADDSTAPRHRCQRPRACGLSEPLLRFRHETFCGACMKPPGFFAVTAFAALERRAVSKLAAFHYASSSYSYEGGNC